MFVLTHARGEDDRPLLRSRRPGGNSPILRLFAGSRLIPKVGVDKIWKRKISGRRFQSASREAILLHKEENWPMIPKVNSSAGPLLQRRLAAGSTNHVLMTNVQRGWLSRPVAFGKEGLAKGTFCETDCVLCYRSCESHRRKSRSRPAPQTGCPP